MSEFLLSKTVDKNKVFLTKLSNIEERLDPPFYKAVENIRNNIEKRAKYECNKLVKSCSIKRGRFGHRPRNDPRFYGGEYPFIQTGDIVKASENYGKIEFTQTLNELGLKTSKMFQPPQLLFTIAANIGDTAILDFPSCFPDSIVAIVPNDKNKLLLEYFDIYLKFIKPYVVDLAPYSAQKNLNNQQLAQVPVIIPPIEIQKRIIEIYQEALFVKQKKETQAKQLIENIDEYLLKELGITLPVIDNSLQNRIFYTSLIKVSGKRLDCDYYSIHYSTLEDAIGKSTYKIDKLSTVVTNIASGKTATSSEYSDEKSDYPIIKVGSYSSEFIDLGKTDYTKSENNIEAHKGDIFILSAAHQAEYVGRFIKYLNEEPKIPTAYVGELICVRADKTVCNSMYLFSLLSLDIFKTLINREKTGQTSHVYGKDIKHIKIPIPSIEKQNEIAQNIWKIREQSKQLVKEAVEELEKAKQKIEQLILINK